MTGQKKTGMMLAIVMLCLTACTRESAPDSGSELEQGIAAVEEAATVKGDGNLSGNEKAGGDLREGTSEYTVKTPDDFPDAYGIHPDAIAVMGFSAGGIQAGEFLMHYDEEVNGTALDPSYVPDGLDEIPAHVSACGMIYSFYGRLSVGNMDPDWLAEGNLPPTFYVYGTEDPFYRQFEQQYDVIRGMGIPAERIVLNGWPHGFGSDGGWVGDYAAWLEEIF